jgi:hypothetical protein
MAKRIEDLTTEEQATFRSEIGVNTESVLALLEDSDIPVASIQLADATGLALPAGSLSLNASDQLVIHDADSNAEDLPHLVNSLESINFATRILAGSINNTTFSKKLADIKLSSASITNGKILHIFGDTFASWSGGDKPNFESRFVICKAGTSPESSGFHFFVGMGNWSESIRFQIPFIFSVSSGVSTLNLVSSRSAGISLLHDNGVISTSASITDGVDLFIESVISALATESLHLEIHIVTNDNTDDVSADFYFSGNISAISQ